MNIKQIIERIASAKGIVISAIISITGIVSTGVFLGTILLSEGILAITVLVILWYALETARMKAGLAEQNTCLQETNLRAEKLFIGQNKPLIDITPIAIGQSSKGTHVTITLSINNYSGFKALNIGCDIKYGDRGWHGEWIKASEQTGGLRLGVPYDPLPKVYFPKLESGETGKEEIEGEYIWSSGALNLENEVCQAKNREMPIQIRVRWENENHHIFDEVHEYKLRCTIAFKNDGRSFTFIPVGIVSKKGSYP